MIKTDKDQNTRKDSKPGDTKDSQAPDDQSLELKERSQLKLPVTTEERKMMTTHGKTIVAPRGAVTAIANNMGINEAQVTVINSRKASQPPQRLSMVAAAVVPSQTKKTEPGATGDGARHAHPQDTKARLEQRKLNIFECQDEQLEGTMHLLSDYNFSTPGCSRIEDYQCGKGIGKGAYAEVREALHRRTGERVAIKQYDRFKLMDLQRKKQAIREIKIMSMLDHPYIVKLLESIDTAKHVFLVLEYAHGESLHSHLKAAPNRQFPEEKAKNIIKQLLEAVEYLHKKKVAHRDIKLENIIIDNAGYVKLIDFGFCCNALPDSKLRMFCGTPSYMAPEIVQRKEYSGPPVDIWACGILLYALLCGRFPFKGRDSKELYRQIARGHYTFPEGVNLSLEVKQLVMKMLVVNPVGRHTATSLLNDPCLKAIRLRNNSMGSEPFLSTNESSNIIPQNLAAGGLMIGHLNSSTGASLGNGIKQI